MRINGFYLFTILGILIGSGLHAQTKDENNNRAVYNRIEYFYNANQLDSIYNLASDSFKEEISADKLLATLKSVQTLGKIKNAEKVAYSNGAARYRLDLESATFALKLAVDSNMQFYGFLIEPFTDEIKKPENKTDVISNVEAKNPLDLFVDSIARSYAKEGSAQSLAVAVIHKSKINTFFYGETDKGNNTLPDANTLYEIGSITKTFTASLLADMVNKGLIGLDDPITKVLPDSLAQNADLQQITFKMLANHSSGLPRLPDNVDKNPKFTQADPYAAYDRKALFSYLKNFKATKEPGTEYEYSNLGFGLLGELLSIIGKKPYYQLVKENILTPLEMVSTFDKINPKAKNLAIPHDSNGTSVPFWTFQAMSGGGSLKSSLNDLLRYTIAQLTYPETEIQKAMHLTKQFTLFVPPNSDIGLGWRMNMMDGVIAYEHTGATAGSNAFVGFVPDEKSVVIILSNSTTKMDKMGNELLQKVLQTK
ncbi:serine hydrolase [Sphingobacterium lactis]|uniref:serine hydrolase n=1 Tax=Sphingobacterium lactis TaxID=797291 RepID=UPI003DA3E1EF